jgi:ubiquinone/menaquinone biosynthesis C-methylase UbiE
VSSLAALAPAGATVLEVGMGTGRLTEILLSGGARVLGCDRAPAMLAQARRRLGDGSPSALFLADASALPLRGEVADMAVAGWVFGHFCEWHGVSWRTTLTRALAELSRVVNEGGPIVILETLGTGAEKPGPPTPELGRYYRHLEEQGFARQVLATDYSFADVEEAAQVCGWFFGEELASRIRARGWRRVPEWTGLWHRRRSPDS